MNTDSKVLSLILPILDLTCFGCFREDLVLVWFSLVWLSMVKFGLRQHPSEASVNVSSGSDYFWLF